MVFEAAFRRREKRKKTKKKCALCLSRVSPLWRFTRDCLVLSSLKACRRCSSVKTGSLQCCNLMAHAAKRAAELFTGLCNPLVYPTELPGQVESRAKTLHRKCGVFFCLFFFFSTKQPYLFCCTFKPFSRFVTLLHPALAGGERAKLFFMHHRFYGVQIALGFHSVVIVTCFNNYR